MPQPFLNMLLPLGAAVVALAAALAAYVMVKFYGVIFLGQHRERALAEAHDAGWPERLGLAWLAAGCVLLGVLPDQLSPACRPRDRSCSADRARARRRRWWLLDAAAGGQAALRTAGLSSP